ncbi:hypothetical protein CYLTODRAFT_492969 [Cylindrobasidium torrendii FP15055 ss-10]|uniref:DUF7587 domain-containing protein n=1 Tax=Cylindrobasidium torrendii FP15055 ss-10 TaxID=1314674 RepID=A0A0D7B327_9AGAR|nr:hypothetical protein CYLTODRAFT_492969 [Cylindrobasidium torrendii FP15055 ss-10]
MKRSVDTSPTGSYHRLHQRDILFRVVDGGNRTPKRPPPLKDRSATDLRPAYLAPGRYNGHLPPVGLSATLRAVASHIEPPASESGLEKFHNPKSPFLSTTTSFVWALWEAARRSKIGIQHVAILIINAKPLAQNDMLWQPNLPGALPDPKYYLTTKQRSRAQYSSEVLVKEGIPAYYVMAEIEWTDVASVLRDSAVFNNLHTHTTYAEACEAYRESAGCTTMEAFVRTVYELFRKAKFHGDLKGRGGAEKDLFPLLAAHLACRMSARCDLRRMESGYCSLHGVLC